MKKIIVIYIFLLAAINVFSQLPSYAEDNELHDIELPKIKLNNNQDSQISKKTNKKLKQVPLPDLKSSFMKANIHKNNGVWDKRWNFIKGQPTDDAVLLGMYSEHTGYSEGTFNETNNLIGVDYSGYSAGSFKNSFSEQTYYVGITRKLYEKYLSGDVKFDVKYKLVGLHGYQNHYPDLFGITPVIMPVFGFSRGYGGTDIMIIPSNKPIFVINFRVNLPDKKSDNKDKNEKIN